MSHVTSRDQDTDETSEDSVKKKDYRVSDAIRWNSDGLVPVIVQEATTQLVLMMAWMNAQSLHLTLTTGYMTYFSRSRNRLWQKGEQSGNRQKLIQLHLDCDGDTLLALIHQHGTGACHTGSVSCFFRTLIHDNTKSYWESNHLPNANTLDST